MILFQNQKGSIHLFAVLLVLVGIGIGSYLIQQRTNIFPQAKQNETQSHLDDDYNPTATIAKPVSAGSLQVSAAGLVTSLPDLEKPNIIFIVTDDQPPIHLGLAGNPVLKTPNIDALGRSGMYFKNAYLPVGHCAPSRASIWTGKLPHNHGVIHNGLILPPDQLTISEVLKQNNYQTAIIGKCHLGDPQDPEVYKRGFDTRIIAYPDVGFLADWYNFQVSKNGVKENVTQYQADYFTDEAIKFINNQDSSKPFYLWLSPFSPHTPTTPPRGSNRYNLDQIALPVSINDNLANKPPQQSVFDARKGYLGLGLDENQRIAALKQKIKDEYEVLSNIDDNVGKILQTVDAKGIRDKTIIVYLSDNGYYFGEHGFYGKSPSFYDDLLKTPLIISYPKLVKSNSQSGAYLSTIDLFPTILDLLKVPVPADIQGKSFLNLLSSKVDTHRKSVYLEYERQNGISSPAYPMRGVVKDGFKWTQYMQTAIDGITYDGFDYELYDLKNDPLEVNNILKRFGKEDKPLERMLIDPTYGKIIQNLRKERAIWATDTSDIRRLILSNGQVNNITSNSLQVSWNVSAGNPTAEIEYREKDCESCSIMELNDFSHMPREYKYTLSKLRPDTTYIIRIFGFFDRGGGGYIDIEGKTASNILPKTSCTADSQCSSNQVCQRVCTASYPPICKPGVCVEKTTTPLSSPSGLTSGGVSGSSPQQ